MTASKTAQPVKRELQAAEKQVALTTLNQLLCRTEKQEGTQEQFQKVLLQRL